jgi:hypothetical protein
MYCGNDCSGKPAPQALAWADLQRKACAPNMNYPVQSPKYQTQMNATNSQIVIAFNLKI